MSDQQFKDKVGKVTAEEARECLQRFVNSHFKGRNKGETARFSIPVDPRRDDDVRLSYYIDQSASDSARLKELMEIAENLYSHLRDRVEHEQHEKQALQALDDFEQFKKGGGQANE